MKSISRLIPGFLAIYILEPLAKNWRINGQLVLVGNPWLTATFLLGFLPSLFYKLILNTFYKSR